VRPRAERGRRRPAIDATTVLIRTIARPSVADAVESALAEKLPVLVVSDGKDLRGTRLDRCDPTRVSVVTLGRSFGWYGSMAINVGAALARTPYVSLLDDDDALVPGAGDVIRDRLAKRPDVDIWIPTLVYKDGHRSCLKEDGGFRFGNVSHPTYRVDVFTRVPFTHDLTPEDAMPSVDYMHVWSCLNAGYSLDWFGADIVYIRPALENSFGLGRP